MDPVQIPPVRHDSVRQGGGATGGNTVAESQADQTSRTEGTPQRARENPGGKTTDTSWHKLFLESLRNHGIVRQACKEAVVGRRTAYTHRDRFPEFAAQWEDALEDHRDIVRAEVIRRGIQGVDKPIFYQGERVDTVKEYSDRMLELHAKALCPEYREKHQLEHTGPGGGGLTVTIVPATPPADHKPEPDAEAETEGD